MASTYTIQNTVNFASAYIKGMPLNGVGTVANEPALTIANMVMQTILGAPFCWRWNRVAFPFAAQTTEGQQDYPQTLANFGFLEKTFLNSSTGNSMELETRLILSPDTSQGRPNYIAPQMDNNAGTVTFRLSPIPDAAYSVTAVFQSKAVLLTALTQTWAPLPDEMGYIYNLGFMAFAMMYANDNRFPWAMQRFLANLLGASEGLSEQQKSIFLGNWAPWTSTMERGQLMPQMGVHARAGG